MKKKNNTTQHISRLLRHIDTVHKLVDKFFKNDINKSNLWMSTPNPNFGNITPVEMICNGRAAKLLKFIKQQLDSNIKNRKRRKKNE